MGKRRAHLLPVRLLALLHLSRGPTPPLPREEKEEDQHEEGDEE
jgi:hypothetical protein